MSEAKIEETYRQAEIFIDSGTQKLLRGLAYFHYLRELIRKSHGAWQYTLTHQPAHGVRENQDRNKKWTMRLPKERKDLPFEYGLWCECWHCNRVFQKKLFCKKCGFFICLHCKKCGCHLKKCCLKVARKFLRAVSGKVAPMGKSDIMLEH